MNTDLIFAAPPDYDLHAFAEALLERRQRVYDYLESWPGASEFKPADIHDGIFSYIKRRGKALRPMLVLLSCGAVGGDEEQALPAAAAVEVYQTWTLVHDDIIDRDETRRGSPTVHADYTARARQAYNLPQSQAAHYGTAVAILVGDMQQSWCYSLLADLHRRGVDAPLVLELIQRMADWLTPQLLEGELLDVQMSVLPREDLTEAQVLEMLSKKTGALLEYSAWCGARIGLGNQPDADGYAQTLGRFAYLCGTAFQLQDDLLGLTADASTLGKPVGSDIREGKHTLLVYKALTEADTEQRRRLFNALGNSEASPDAVAAAIEVVAATGAQEYVSDLANSYIGQALGLLEELPPSPYKQLLRSWATFVLARQH